MNKIVMIILIIFLTVIIFEYDGYAYDDTNQPVDNEDEMIDGESDTKLPPGLLKLIEIGHFGKLKNKGINISQSIISDFERKNNPPGSSMSSEKKGSNEKNNGNKRYNSNKDSSGKDYSNKQESKVNNKTSKNRVGKGRFSTSTPTFSGQLLEEVEPLIVDESILIAFGLTLEDKEMFESAYPSVVPLENTYVTSDFGRRSSIDGQGKEYHKGVDLKANYQEVFATGSGIVTYAGYQGSYGKIVVIDHGYGIITKYAHNSKNLVAVGDRINRYDVIAISGNSGNSTGPHLHYEILINEDHKNPLEIIYNR